MTWLLAGAAVFMGVLAAVFLVLFRSYRARYYAEAGRDPGFPIPTVELYDFDPLFAQGPYGTTPEAEALIIGKGPRVTGGTSDTEAWVLGALATRANRIFEFGTATGRTAYVLARNAPEDALVDTLTLHPDAVQSYQSAPGDHGKAERIAQRESRFASFLYEGTPAAAKIRQHYGDSKTFDHSPWTDSCDLIFVDGSHAYSYVVNDSAKALEMVKPGGIVLWHDYKGRTGGGADVYRALNELRKRLPLVRLAGTSIVAFRAAAALALLLVAPLLAPTGVAAQPAPFQVVETTIEEIHAAYREGRLTARALIESYQARIAAYDRAGPAFNALTTVSPSALTEADSLDAFLARTGNLAGPLHGIPVIVKDNYDVHGFPTTAGSRVLEEAYPPDDATMVRLLRAAGAIVLARSAMAEFAFSPLETVGSAHAGYTFNPYALNRVPAGSSGGTAAAVTANLGAVGLGTDTGNSIRGPSAHTALVGIRPTLGLTSRDGIVPLYLERDVGGPMTRTVKDAARLLEVLAGVDPADPATAAAAGHIPGSYTAALDAGALRGARIGVVRRLAERRGADPEVVARFEAVLDELRAAGAVVVDSVELPVLDSVRVVLCSSFRRDLEAYLATLGEGAPVRTLEEVVEAGRHHWSIDRRLRGFLDDGDAGDPERCRRSAESVGAFQAGVRQVLAEHRLDALAYPTWSNPPRLIGDMTSPAGDNSQNLAPPAGFPAITVPAGWVRDGTLPVGLQLLGDAWTEGRLLALAYAYEQATHHRRPPTTAPELPTAGR